MRPAVCILLVFSVLAGAGCRRSRSVEDSRRQIAESFGQLPGLSETPDAELRAELARIIEEKATPELLTRQRIPDEENAAQGLAGLFEPSRIGPILEESVEIFPPGKFEFDPTRLERAIRFRERYEAERQECREALRRPKCSFGIEYQAGFAADLSFIDVVRICARLEAFAAAQSLANDDVAPAIESLETMFRLAACLGQEKHATVRLQAALLREEALAVLQTIVGYPEISESRITRDQLGRLYATVEAQLGSWPPDRDAWIGDRALGMHAYELVRAGRLAELLTGEELERFAEEGILEELPAAAQRNVNPDELFYLQAMRKIIDACARPYFERQKTLIGIREELQEGRNSPQFPLVAARLLLVDMDKGHVLQARDRACCEAWALALAVASGRQPPSYQVSPLWGGKYEVAVGDGLVTVCSARPNEGNGVPTAEVPNLARPRQPQ
jgi:hypothetical protein